MGAGEYGLGTAMWCGGGPMAAQEDTLLASLPGMQKQDLLV